MPSSQLRNRDPHALRQHVLYLSFFLPLQFLKQPTGSQCGSRGCILLASRTERLACISKSTTGLDMGCALWFIGCMERYPGLRDCDRRRKFCLLVCTFEVVWSFLFVGVVLPRFNVARHTTYYESMYIYLVDMRHMRTFSANC